MNYRLSTSAAGLLIEDMPLLAEPHPTENLYFADEKNLALDGMPIGKGDGPIIWHYKDNILTIDQWAQLMSFVGNKPGAWVYLRTQHPAIISSAFHYVDYSAIMHRPTGTSRDGYRFTDVQVIFTNVGGA